MKVIPISSPGAVKFEVTAESIEDVTSLMHLQGYPGPTPGYLHLWKLLERYPGKPGIEVVKSAVERWDSRPVGEEKARLEDGWIVCEYDGIHSIPDCSEVIIGKNLFLSVDNEGIRLTSKV